MTRQNIANVAYPRDLRFFSAGHNAAITGAGHPVGGRQEGQSVQPKRNPLDDFIYHPALSHMAPGAQIPAIIELSIGNPRTECELPSSRGDDGDESIPRRASPVLGRGLAGLGATLRLPLPWVDIGKAYSEAVRKTVTLVTVAWHGSTRRAHLDSSLGTLSEQPPAHPAIPRAR